MEGFDVYCVLRRCTRVSPDLIVFVLMFSVVVKVQHFKACLTTHGESEREGKRYRQIDREKREGKVQIGREEQKKIHCVCVRVYRSLVTVSTFF